MNGCSYFRCDNCSNIKPISEQHIIKAAYTAFNHNSHESFRYFIYHVQLCNECFEKKKETKDDVAK